MKRKTSRAATWILNICLLKVTPAQYSVYDFDPVVVTGCLNEIQLSASPKHVLVIDQQTIQSTRIESLDQLLQKIVGLDVRSQGPLNIQSDISIRGAGAEQTLILIDGVKISDPQTAHHNLDIPLNPENIKQIEIIKGGASKQYGSTAYAGVINFITRKVDKPEVSIEIAGGDNSYYHAASSLAFQKDNFYSHLTAKIQHSDGYRYNTDYDNLILFFKNTYQNSVGRVLFSTGYRKKDFGANQFYYVNYQNQREDTETFFMNINGFFNRPNGSFTAGLSGRRHADHYLLDFSNPSFYENNHFTNTIHLNLKRTFQATRRTHNIALDGTVEAIQSNNLGSHQRQNIRIVYEYQWRPNNRLALQLGSSANFYSEWKGVVVPGIDCQYRFLPTLVWHGSINSAYRIPTFTEFYYHSPANRGNPDLKPEKAWTMEQNILWKNGARSAQFGIFIRDGKAQIDWVRENTAEPWQVKNITRIVNSGIETTLSFPMKSIFINSVSLSYCYTYTDKHNAHYESKYLLSSLTHQLILDFHPFDILGIQQNWNLRFEDRLNHQENTVIDVHITKNLRHFTFSLSITNLLNSRYADYSGIPMPGRWITFGLKYKLIYE